GELGVVLAGGELSRRGRGCLTTAALLEPVDRGAVLPALAGAGAPRDRGGRPVAAPVAADRPAPARSGRGRVVRLLGRADRDRAGPGLPEHLHPALAARGRCPACLRRAGAGPAAPRRQPRAG